MSHYPKIILLLPIYLFVITTKICFAENPHKDRLPTVLPFAVEQLPDSNLIPVEFEFHHTLSPGDSGVGINGSFNGWGDVFKCQNVGGDKWIVVLYLAPGQYQYKFVTYIDTVGQAGVIGWYTDPLNPDYGGPYRDSYITVSDPMIYYFLPSRDSETTEIQPEITAKMSTAIKNSLVLESIIFTIDGTDIPNAWNYFNTETNRFSYLPPEKLDIGTHSLLLSVTNSEGTTIQGATNFTILKGIIEAPYTLLFDGRSPVLELANPVQRVSFEWMDEPQSHQLNDPDDDGIFTYSLNLKVNKRRIYRVIVNEDIYLENDPTNPEISEELRSIVRKVVDPNPRFIDFNPPQGTVFPSTDTTITFLARVSPSDSNYIIDPNSIHSWFDDQEMALTIDTGSDTVEVSFSANLSEGRHIVRFFASDEVGMPAHPAVLTVSSYPPNTGYHYVDAEDDDNGYGTYTSPSGVDSGSVEIQSVHINLNDTMDSLNVVIDMENISDFTRIGFYILNSLEGNLIAALDNIELRIPDWQDRGVFAILGAPNSTTLRQNFDNQLLISQRPVRTAFDLLINEDADTSNEFRFSLAIEQLEKFLGSFNQNWYFIAYSYIVDANGSFEVMRDEGGVREEEDPDVYDLAFCDGLEIQKLLLRNFITRIKIGGPRIAAIGSVKRGAIGLSGIDLNSQFIPAPLVKLFARGGKIYQDSVRVVGSVNDSSLSMANIHVNNNEYEVVIENNQFEKIIKLGEGVNKIYASVTYNNEKISRSIPIEYEYIVDHSPIVKINTIIANNKITLDGKQTYSPDSAPMEFSWHQDASNPQQVVFSSTDNPITSFDIPTTLGEYYFTLTAATDDYSGWARTVIVVDDSAHIVDLETWHPAWVDSMILYEIFVRTYSVTGVLDAVKGRMGMMKDFGINCIWLMPIHPSPSTHGYWITDYYDINPEYGTLNDFRQLVNEAHKNGIKIIMDLVVNHTVDTHPFMLDALENGEYSPYRDFYYWNPDGSYQYLYSWVNLPSINYTTEWVRNYLIDMCKWWIQQFNIDGFRCDVAHAIEEGRPEGPAFWQQWRRELKQIKPDIFLLAEAAASDSRYFDGKFDSGYDYWLYGELRNALSGTGSANSINQAVEYYIDNIPGHARPMRYIENHDESRFLNSFSLEQTKLAAVLEFTLPGIPLIYAGQETGELTSRGIVRWSDPYELKPFYQKLIDMRKDHSALRLGRYVHLPVQNKDVYAFLRKDENDNFLIISNLSSSNQDANISIPISELPYDTSVTFYLNERLTEISVEIKGSDLLDYSFTLEPNKVMLLEFSQIPTHIVENKFAPYQYSLSSNYPNPFNVTTTIRYSIGGKKPADTRLEIFNILGQKVRILVSEKQMPGKYQIKWNGKNDSGIPVGTGIYICRFESEKFVKSIKILVLK